MTEGEGRGVSFLVSGQCPMGCGRTLMLGEGGHVTCSFLSCPDPTAADTILQTAPIFQTIRETIQRLAREGVPV